MVDPDVGGGAGGGPGGAAGGGRPAADPIAQRLARLRGPVEPRRHNARTIAALTGNPGCTRRAVLDSAGIDKELLARTAGFAPRFGQSRFAITRGNAFEARVKADGCAELLRLLRERLGLAITAADYADLGAGPDRESQTDRHTRARTALIDGLGGPAGGGAGAGAGQLLDHPLLSLEIAGQPVYLEPDLSAARLGGRYHVVEIKSFPVIDDQADPAKVSAAAVQAAVYVLALRDLLDSAGHDPALVSHEVVLVCPRDFTNQPTAALIDVRRQLAALRRQLTRMARVDQLLAGLPDDLTFDLARDGDGRPTRTPDELRAALARVEARYAPECLAACELAYLCRAEARGGTAALGRSVRDELGGVESATAALDLATGAPAPNGAEAASAELLRTAARLRTEALAERPAPAAPALAVPAAPAAPGSP